MFRLATSSASIDQVVKTVNNGDEFDFGQITYKKPGTYTYTVAERTPDEHDSSWLPGFGAAGGGATFTLLVPATVTRADAAGTEGSVTR